MLPVMVRPNGIIGKIISHLTEKNVKIDNNKLTASTSYVATTLHLLKNFLVWPGKILILNWK